MVKSARVFACGLSVCLLTLAACLPGPAGPRSATLDELVNIVEARAAPADPFAAITLGFSLEAGGQVQTGDSASARMKFDDGSILRLSEQTKFTLTGNDGRGTAHTALEFGKLWVSLASGILQVDTPVGVASVRGSYAVFEYEPGDDEDSTEDDTLTVRCLEGTCVARNDTLNVDLGNLEAVVISNGGKSAEKMTLHDYDVEQFLAVNPESGALVATLTAGPPKSENGNTIYGTARATMNENDRATRDAARTTQGKPGKGPDATPGPPADAGNATGSGGGNWNGNGGGDEMP